jgi:acetyl esterase/lipase
MFHLLLLSLVAVLSTGFLNAQITETPGVEPKPSLVIDLYSGDAPGFVSGGNPEKVVNDRIRNVSKPQMFVWFPKERSAKGTAMIICPGGGYKHHAMNLHAGSVVALLNKKGITVIGLKYRTRYGKNDVVSDALADGKRAVRLARAHAKEWQLDPSRIGVQGYSAGANLCLNLAANSDLGDPTSADPVERLSSGP